MAYYAVRSKRMIWARKLFIWIDRCFTIPPEEAVMSQAAPVARSGICFEWF